MSIETDFRAQLVARAALTALVGQRIAQDAVPEGAEGPVVVFAVRHEPLYAVDGTQVADQASITTQAWADTALLAAQVADEVTAAVAEAPAARGARVVERSTTFDPDLGLDGVVLTVEWWG